MYMCVQVRARVLMYLWVRVLLNLECIEYNRNTIVEFAEQAAVVTQPLSQPVLEPIEPTFGRTRCIHPRVSENERAKFTYLFMTFAAKYRRSLFRIYLSESIVSK